MNNVYNDFCQQCYREYVVSQLNTKLLKLNNSSTCYFLTFEMFSLQFIGSKAYNFMQTKMCDGVCEFEMTCGET